MHEPAAGTGMADLTRAHPWGDTPLGPHEGWPVSLRSAASLVLDSRFPMSLWWGHDLRVLYNDAYVPVLAAKHPQALGRPAEEVWAEIWHIIGPQTLRVVAGGGATWNEHLLLPMQRKGFLEETYFTFSYSPVRDDAAGIAGVLVTCQETTTQVQGERQLQLLRELGARTAGERSASGVCAAVSSVLGAHDADLPFALVYLRDEAGALHLAGRSGFEDGAAGDPAAPPAQVWPFDEAGADASGLAIRPIPAFLGAAPSGRWNVPPRQVAIAALEASAGSPALGYLVAGLNPLREVDHGYARMFRLAADQIASALRAARAFEEERRRAEALAEIDRQKSAFFSNVSHEFRTPLTLMIGPTEDALASPERALAGEALEAVHRNELRLLKLVNALLDFARLEAGQMVAAYEPTDLAGLTSDLTGSFRSAFERAGLVLDVACDDIAGEVFVDRGMWEKVVLNLLSNALKFTFEGGVTVRLRDDAHEVVLTVQDTGVGIAADEQPRVFERFHRVEGVRARTHEGSGIGLSLVSDLVRLHGGRCALESRPDVGTTVTVRLPKGRAHLASDRIRERATPAAATRSPRSPFVLEALRWLPDDETADAGAEPADGPAPDAGTAGRILVVDDNADMRDYLARLLSRRWTVETARDGVEALEAVRRRRPDVVLTDVMMPRLDGLGLLRALRADAATAELPVIVLSARAGEEARVEGVELGADDYLVKPFAARELMARVQSQLRLAQAMRERAELLARERSAREAADLQRRQLRAIFEQAPTLIAVFRGPEHVVELANHRICEAWGREPDAVLGRPFCEAVPEAQDQPWRPLLDGVYRSGEPYVGTEMAANFRRPGSDELQTGYYNFVWAPLREDDRVQGIIVVATDVTVQVLARRELGGLREAAEAANHAKDAFLAMLGHELRNPLAPIMTALQLMKLRGGDSVERERAVIERQVRHVVSLVDDLLDVSRITRGKVTLRKTYVELADVVAKAIEMVSPLLEQQRHELGVEVPVSGLGVYGDVDRLAQVASNILNNAAKYTPPGGRIRVQGTRDGDEVVLSVRDNGVGLAPAMLTRAFDPFVQEGQTLDRSRGGLGLGLAIARSLAELHGGAVAASSDGEGRGATFTVRLPHQPLPTPAEDRAVASAGTGGADDGGHAPRVLVVDDNVDAAELLAEYLKGQGFVVRTAHDGLAALSVAHAFAPDVALVDIGLPVMDGYEVARRLTGGAACRPDLRLVAVTGYGQQQDRERSAAAGFHDHLVKPVDMARLEAGLRNLLARPVRRAD